MAAIASRSPDKIAGTLTGWLTDKLGPRSNPIISNLAAPPSNGFSNDTILFDATWNDADADPRSERLVLRIEPANNRLFLDARFRDQYDLMSALEQHTDLPVPAVFWFEDDPEIFGAPFFFMARAEGRAPPDKPLYNIAGWLHDSPVAEQRNIWRNAIDMLVKVQTVPVELISFIAQPELGTTGLDQIFVHAHKSFEWAAAGENFPIAQRAYDWLAANIPVSRPTGLSWGDARIGNMLFSAGQVQAILDWEMLSLGGGEMDLGWWLFFDEYFCGFGADRLPGLGTRVETIALWELATGRAAADLKWYEIFAGFRFATILIRQHELRRLRGAGKERKVEHNPGFQLLSQKVDGAAGRTRA